MATPTTRDEILELLRKSGVVKPAALDQFLAEHPDLPAEPKAVAAQMVQSKLLTTFQAKLLLAGRYKGFRLGAYILLDQLGQGGMGAVYLADHEQLHRKAAIKVLPPGGNKITIERFLREARAVAALDHPNIVRLHDVGREGEVHFLVMEHVEGQTLDQLVTSAGPLPAQRAVEYVAQACAGLQHAYERGFIHRDIKPANLILAKDGTVKILDMGLARSNDKNDQLTEMLDAGAIVGTADYISPEQAMNDPGVDIRTDIYSLGATFFAIVTGRPPFDGPTASKLVQHQVKDPPSVTTLDRTFPKGLSAVIARMMAKRPDDRYQTPAEVIEALQPWQNESAKVAAGLSQTLAGQTGKLSRISGRLEPPEPKGKAKSNRTMLYAVLGGVSAAIVLGLGITVALALSGNDRNDAKATTTGASAPETPAITPPPETAPTTPPAPPPPTTKPTVVVSPDPPKLIQAGKPVYVFDAGTIPEFRAVKEKLKIVGGADAQFPTGIYVQAFREGSRGEFRREVNAGKPVLTMCNETEPASAQFVIELEDRIKVPLTPDKRYLATIEYATTGNGAGVFLADGPPPKYKKLASAALTPTKGRFESATFSFVRTPGMPIRLIVDVNSIGRENTILVNRIDLLEDPAPAATAPPDRVVYSLDLAKSKPVKVTVLTYMDNKNVKTAREVKRAPGDVPLPLGWYGRCYLSEAECETEIAEVDGKPAIGVRPTKSPPNPKGPCTAMLFTPRIECPSGVARVKFEYRTALKSGKSIIKARPEGKSASQFATLPTPTTGWETFEHVVEIKPAAAAVFEIFNNGEIGEELWIRGFTIIEATPADVKKK